MSPHCQSDTPTPAPTPAPEDFLTLLLLCKEKKTKKKKVQLPDTGEVVSGNASYEQGASALTAAGLMRRKHLDREFFSCYMVCIGISLVPATDVLDKMDNCPKMLVNFYVSI